MKKQVKMNQSSFQTEKCQRWELLLCHVNVLLSASILSFQPLSSALAEGWIWTAPCPTLCAVESVDPGLVLGTIKSWILFNYLVILWMIPQLFGQKSLGVGHLGLLPVRQPLRLALQALSTRSHTWFLKCLFYLNELEVINMNEQWRVSTENTHIYNPPPSKKRMKM